MKEPVKPNNIVDCSPDEKSDTVLTGLNTVELSIVYPKLLSDSECQLFNTRSKSLGNEVKTPFIRDTPSMSNKLEKIEEIEESQNSDLDEDDDVAERREKSPFVRLPAAKRLKEKKNKSEIDVK